MLKLYPKQLLEKFNTALGGVSDMPIGSEIPFVISLAQGYYFIFLKNLSPAYFKGSPDISRIQLPVLNHPAIASGMPLIVLGYDADNNAFAGWNPKRIKRRINSRSNVSLYSRISLQRLPDPDGFNEGKLASGELFYVFHSSLLPTYISSIDELFLKDSRNMEGGEDIAADAPFLPAFNPSQNILSEVTDVRVIAEMLPLLREAKILDAASLCYSHYGKYYPAMTLASWFDIAKSMYSKLG